MKLGATRNKNHVAKKALPKRVKEGVAQGPAKESDVLLKWDIGISEGVKRKKRSLPSASSKRCKAVKSPDTVATASPSITSVPPVEGCPIEDAMDDELLACVFMRLNMKDLSASMRTCKRWRRVACKEDIWEHIPLPANVAGALPSYPSHGTFQGQRHEYRRKKTILLLHKETDLIGNREETFWVRRHEHLYCHCDSKYDG